MIKYRTCALLEYLYKLATFPKKCEISVHFNLRATIDQSTIARIAASRNVAIFPSWLTIFFFFFF